LREKGVCILFIERKRIIGFSKERKKKEKIYVFFTFRESKEVGRGVGLKGLKLRLS
jgi:hypothetical protein